MSYHVTLIPGDGIGPEVTDSAVKVIEATGVKVVWEKVEAGIDVISKYGTPIPDSVIESVKKNKVALKGPLTTLVAKGFPSVNVALRKKLDLYANVRPCHSLKGVKTRFEEVDLVIMRENTEDLYSGIEHIVAPGVAEGIKIITSFASDRIANFTFNYARAKGRKKVTVVHKANIMKVTDGLFLQSAQKVSNEYPEIEYEEKIVDNLAMQLVMNPGQFDVLLLTNLYGDIVSDLCAGLVGGLGVVPGANIGDEYAVFEAVHGSAPDIAGKNVSNPMALIFSSLIMLRYLGENKAADNIMNSVCDVLKEKKKITRDLGGTASTTEFTDEVVRKVEEGV